MLKIILILFIGLIFESTGIVFLKKGMEDVSKTGEVKMTSIREIARAIKAGVTDGKIWAGVCFEALFFVCLLIMMAKSDISFIWPLTGLSFVFSTFAAILFLGETVSTFRWIGVLLIVIGSVVIGYTQQSKEKAAVPTATKSTAE